MAQAKTALSLHIQSHSNKNSKLEYLFWLYSKTWLSKINVASPGIEPVYLQITALDKQTVPQRIFHSLRTIPLHYTAKYRHWKLI
jgi:hypothetical protein